MGDAAVGWGRAWSLTSPGPPALAIVEERAGHCNHWAGDDSRPQQKVQTRATVPPPLPLASLWPGKGFQSQT
jgi:hypothetical protein